LPGMKRPFTLFESVREFPVPLHGGNLSQRSFPTRRASGPPNPLVLGPELWRSHRMVDWGNMVFRAEEVRAFKRLDGFDRAKGHFSPKFRSNAAHRFLVKLLAPEIRDE